jgi:predicted dehydrogenase
MQHPKAPQRWLIVGRGSIGTRHLALARHLVPDAVIGVLGHSAKPKPVEADCVFVTLAEAVAFAPAAAVIANPAPFHLEAALALARAGANLLVEKPLAAVSAGLQDLIAICGERKIVLMVGYNLRFSPSLRFFRDAIETNMVGRILSVRAEVGQNLEQWRDRDYRHSVSARAALGGGVLLELSHEIDYLRWIFGDIAWVGAATARQSDLDIDVEDTANLILGFAHPTGERGPLVTVNLDFVRHDVTRTCTAIGAAGTLRWDGVAGTVSVFRRGAKSWDTLFARSPDRDETYRGEWRHFLECLAGAPPEVTGSDGLAVVKVVEAAKQSASSGTVVHLR